MGGAAKEVVELAVAAAAGVPSPEGVQGGGGKVMGWRGCAGGEEMVDACAVGPHAVAVAVKWRGLWCCGVAYVATGSAVALVCL